MGDLEGRCLPRVNCHLGGVNGGNRPRKTDGRHPVDGNRDGIDGLFVQGEFLNRLVLGAGREAHGEQKANCERFHI